MKKGVEIFDESTGTTLFAASARNHNDANFKAQVFLLANQKTLSLDDLRIAVIQDDEVIDTFPAEELVDAIEGMPEETLAKLYELVKKTA